MTSGSQNTKDLQDRPTGSSVRDFIKKHFIFWCCMLRCLLLHVKSCKWNTDHRKWLKDASSSEGTTLNKLSKLLFLRDRQTDKALFNFRHWILAYFKKKLIYFWNSLIDFRYLRYDQHFFFNVLKKNYCPKQSP